MTSLSADSAAITFSKPTRDPQNDRMYTFTLSPVHVTYANTLRRLILTGVETVAFRSDMTSIGTTTDVEVIQNDTPMTNEMLADRIGLLPLHIPQPKEWIKDKYVFVLKVTGESDKITYVTSSDFKVFEQSGPEVEASAAAEEDSGDEKEIEPTQLDTARFFPANPLTGDTCLIATLQPSFGGAVQNIEIRARASKGTGREHARFCPVSQCSYEYSLDDDEQRLAVMFQEWLQVAKKATNVEKGSERYAELEREFQTMRRKRCYLINKKGEPFSYDFKVETAGVLTVPYIVEKACEVGENMCARYVNMATGDLPEEVTISPANARIIGFDFLFRGHDYTLGNLLQTWMDENMMDKGTYGLDYVGFCIPHPLRDEMVLRVGVRDGQEATARQIVAEAAKGCVKLFQQLRAAWNSSISGKPVVLPSEPSAIVRRPRALPVKKAPM